jgi:hypothetical protein
MNMDYACEIAKEKTIKELKNSGQTWHFVDIEQDKQSYNGEYIVHISLGRQVNYFLIPRENIDDINKAKDNNDRNHLNELESGLESVIKSRLSSFGV